MHRDQIKKIYISFRFTNNNTKHNTNNQMKFALFFGDQRERARKMKKKKK